ncbi:MULTISPECIES: TIGR03862 family flavoprotein [Stenotrophomonas]|uniref:TIGR03862 family flavoprotein n=1 Tax=Stenotrophomonas TaxID=40323 RepID=UPI001CF56399|nr:MULTISPECIES: TIGR03862 family flavoprotein [Stenotrophomonas]MCA7023969.1 TIGR03862 family flavoprotein [Stenotrophomonas acidaminiphila]MCE4073746.1 TIGR03862 family flavoprotein [Stenotrophomonas acidaminiphila]
MSSPAEPGRAGKRVAVVGGGPAGLFAAERLRACGLSVDLYEAKGSPGRKFLVAGKGGLNLTHSEPRPQFDQRYREREAEVAGWLDGFDADALRDWARGLGVDTYVGSSGRVFPLDRKAAPLLRGWVRRLKEQGVRFHVQHRWLGWNGDGSLRLQCGEDEIAVTADATVLALGGGSWPELGSDGAWVQALHARGVDVAPLQPANCGFDLDWSGHFCQRHAGSPLKPVVAHWRDLHGRPQQLQGECVASEYGIEGSLVYAIAADLRETINRDGHALLELDLVPGRDAVRLHADLSRPRKGRSFGEHLRRAAGIDAVKAALVFERLGKDAGDDPDAVARTLKRLPLRLLRPRPMAEAISTAGGVRLEAMNAGLMLQALPGVFCAGEMLDWEAPTGGYLLTACYASALRAAEGVVDWLR